MRLLNLRSEFLIFKNKIKFKNKINKIYNTKWPGLVKLWSQFFHFQKLITQ